MDQERQARLGQGLKRRQNGVDIGHAGIAVRGGPRWIEFDAVNEFRAGGQTNFVRRRAVGQIQRHQRREAAVRRQTAENPVAVGACLGDRGDGRLQIGHDDGAPEDGRRMRQDGCQHSAVAQVQVPVVGTGQGQFMHGRAPPHAEEEEAYEFANALAGARGNRLGGDYLCRGHL
jgi:hypothetical protein